MRMSRRHGASREQAASLSLCSAERPCLAQGQGQGECLPFTLRGHRGSTDSSDLRFDEGKMYAERERPSKSGPRELTCRHIGNSGLACGGDIL